VTIADLVADLRAPTPSVAAELVIPKKEDLKNRITELSADLKRTLSEVVLNFQEDIDELLHRLLLGIGHILELNISNLDMFGKKLALLNPKVMIKQYQEKITNLASQIQVRLNHFLKLRQAEFTKALEKLSSLSPLNILNRGYSITFQMPAGKIIKDAFSIKVGEVIKTRLHKGEILSQVKEVD
jgi:exodeoxyribonuclease VII large subunit